MAAQGRALSRCPGRTTVTVSRLAPERIVALLTWAALPFSEVSAQSPALEESCMELTSEQVEYRPAEVNEGHP